jgi:hypothetical protein
MRALPTASLPHSHPHKRASHRRCANPFFIVDVQATVGNKLSRKPDPSGKPGHK